MVFEYKCLECSNDESDFIFEDRHGMNETPVIKCAECGSLNVERIYSTDTIFYTRGNGYLDVAGRRNDMNKYHLMNDDPYASMRQPGEKEEKLCELRKKGRFDPKPKKFYVEKK